MRATYTAPRIADRGDVITRTLGGTKHQSIEGPGLFVTSSHMTGTGTTATETAGESKP
jgi:hypothetical protein